MMDKRDFITKILQKLVGDCQKRDLEIDTNFAKYYIKLLAQDLIDGLNLLEINSCNIHRFAENLAKKYTNVLDPTMCNLKMCYFFKSQEMIRKPNFVKEKYDIHFESKLKKLFDDILQYPETSDDEMIEKMLGKIQIFIIAFYKLGSPTNHVLLKQTMQSLKRVIGKADLKDHVLKKRYHRLKYLQRLSATVCGILIYNNLDHCGNEDNMRDIREDLLIAQKNTRAALKNQLVKVVENKELVIDALKHGFQIDVKHKTVTFYQPTEILREINKFIALYFKYEQFLKELLEICERTEFLISENLSKLKCIQEKIDEILKYRKANEEELIFPHFVYLSELWQTLILYLNHLIEINQIRDGLESFVTETIQSHSIKIANEVKNKIHEVTKPLVRSFKALTEETRKRDPQANLLKITKYTSEFCTVTISQTNGLLVPSVIKKKYCPNLKIKFGFCDFDMFKYAELNKGDYLKAFEEAVFTSIDLILLFDLEAEIPELGQNKNVPNDRPSKCEYGTQTETVIIGDLSQPNRINTTWNKWDYYRETIRLANMRQRQTHSAQTLLSFGHKNAQNQAYYTRRHF